MAIIKCPECQNEVSDKASACPKCGYPIASEKTNSQTHIKEPQTIFAQENDKEKMVYIAEKDSKGVVITSVLLIIIFAILLIVSRWIALFSLIYIGVFETVLLISYVAQKELYFTNKKVVGRKGIIAEKLLDSPLDKINNISVIKTPLGKSIEITTSSDKHTFSYIANAEGFREMLLKEIDIYKEGEMKKYINLMHR